MYSKDGIFNLLGKINHKIFMSNLCMMKDKKLHPGQFPLLFILCSEDGQVQKQLADKLGIKPSTLNVMVRRLEKNGSVVKKQDPKDQRKSRIYISEQGRSLVESLEKRSEKISRQISDALTEEEKQELIRILTKLDHCLEQQIELEVGKEKDNA